MQPQVQAGLAVDVGELHATQEGEGCEQRGRQELDRAQHSQHSLSAVLVGDKQLIGVPYCAARGNFFQFQAGAGRVAAARGAG